MVYDCSTSNFPNHPAIFSPILHGTWVPAMEDFWMIGDDRDFSVVSHVRCQDITTGWWFYPLVNIQKAIENGHLEWIFPLKMVIFHSYVSLPEGNHLEKYENQLG